MVNVHGQQGGQAQLGMLFCQRRPLQTAFAKPACLHVCMQRLLLGPDHPDSPYQEQSPNMFPPVGLAH